MRIKFPPLARPISLGARKEVPLATFLRNLDLLIGGKIRSLPQLTYLPWSSRVHIFLLGGRAACLFSPFRWGRSPNYADAVVTAEVRGGQTVVRIARVNNPAHFHELKHDHEEGLFYGEKELEGQRCRFYYLAVPPNRHFRLKGRFFQLNESFSALGPLIIAMNEKGEFVKGYHDEYQPLEGQVRPVFDNGRTVGWLLHYRQGTTGMERVSGEVKDWPVYTSADYLKLHFGGRNYVVSRKRFEQLGLSADTAKVDLRIEQGFVAELLGKEPIRAILVRDAKGKVRHASFRTVPKESLPGLPAIIEGANSCRPYGKEMVKLFERAYPLPGGDPDLAFRQVSVLLGPGPAILYWEPAPRFADRTFGFINSFEMNAQLKAAEERFLKEPGSRLLARRYLRVYNRAVKVLTPDQVLPFRLTMMKALRI